MEYSLNMFHPYSAPVHIQTAMAQAMQAMMTGSPLPPNCYVMSIPIEQAHQMLPQLMMNPVRVAPGQMFYPNFPNQYDRYQPLPIAPYVDYSRQNALLPYSNYNWQPYQPNYNYPMLDYGKLDKTRKHEKKRNPGEPHSNVYNSSSFDSHMENLSWSRLFGHARQIRSSKKENSNQAALEYEKKATPSKKATAQSLGRSSSASSTTTSDETIRRVNISTQPTGNETTGKDQTKGSLPFKYSSEFVPNQGKNLSQKNVKKETNLRSDDEFIIQRSKAKSKRS